MEAAPRVGRFSEVRLREFFADRPETLVFPEEVETGVVFQPVLQQRFEFVFVGLAGAVRQPVDEVGGVGHVVLPQLFREERDAGGFFKGVETA